MLLAARSNAFCSLSFGFKDACYTPGFEDTPTRISFMFLWCDPFIVSSSRKFVMKVDRPRHNGFHLRLRENMHERSYAITNRSLLWAYIYFPHNVATVKSFCPTVCWRYGVCERCWEFLGAVKSEAITAPCIRCQESICIGILTSLRSVIICVKKIHLRLWRKPSEWWLGDVWRTRNEKSTNDKGQFASFLINVALVLYIQAIRDVLLYNYIPWKK